MGIATVGRTKMRWEDDVISGLKKMEVTNL